MMERTFGMIKPNAMNKNIIGEIIKRAESNGLKLIEAKIKQLTTDEAKLFYLEHKERPFYDELVTFMTSGPVMVMAFEGENAVDVWRTVMGHTDPAQAEAGTIRKDFGDSIGENAAHGSDAPGSAKRELSFFFE